MDYLPMIPTLLCDRCRKEMLGSLIQSKAFDDERQEVWRKDGKRVRLTRQQWELLCIFRRRPIHWLSVDTLTEMLSLPDKGSVSLGARIFHVRKALEGTGWEIRNLWGVGWRLQQKN
jgi:DNA-binding response OmpR family regulator